MRLSAKKILAFTSGLFISGCGTLTPDYQEFWGSSADNDDKIRLVVKQVECELRRAVRLIESEDIRFARDGQSRQMKWLEGWGVDAAFLFTIDEKSSLNPGISFNTPMQNAITAFPGAVLPASAPLTATASSLNKITTATPQLFSFGVGGQASSEGYRQDKIHIPYKLSELVGPEKNLPSPQEIEATQCVTGDNANASLFIQSDLKI